MVYLHTSIAAYNSTHQSTTAGTRTMNNRKALNPSIQPSCSPSGSVAIDITILIAVIGAFGVLLYPYVMFTFVKFSEIVGPVMSVVIEDVLENPFIYGCLGLSMMCVTAAAWAIVMCTGRKCGNPRCLGLRDAAEFDLQLQTEECVKSCSKVLVKRGLFELPRDHHRELEAELQKMAPPNGRAVLVFRARCGCCVGRMEVPGLRRNQKIKK